MRSFVRRRGCFDVAASQGYGSRTPGRVRILAPAGLICLVLFAVVFGQSQALAGQAANPSGTAPAKAESDAQHTAAEQHQKKLVEDAERLVQLAQQLKGSVDKTNKDVLSVTVVREAERLEKLAHQVRETSR